MFILFLVCHCQLLLKFLSLFETYIFLEIQGIGSNHNVWFIIENEFWVFWGIFISLGIFSVGDADISSENCGGIVCITTMGN